VGTYQAGLYVSPTAILTIGGSGTLNATAGYYSAGIGGSYMNTAAGNSANSTGTIIINSGMVTATGGSNGAGIGGGNYGAGGTVTINDGTITATGGTTAAGIGGGFQSAGGTVTINGGMVTGNSGPSNTVSCGAGIGGGAGGAGLGNGGIIEISGGTVSATSVNYGAGIGGGYNSNGGTITISGGTVTATSGHSGAGIGGGSSANASPVYGSSGNITISGGTVTATGGIQGSGVNVAQDIGYGFNASTTSGSIVITGGSVYPTRGSAYVGPIPTNGSINGDNPVGMLTFTNFAGQKFSIVAAGSVATYTYKGIGHAAAGYLWLAYPGASTEAATAMSTTPASVTAPSTINSAASSTATLNGTYYLNNTYGVTSAYFEWGTSTAYGATIDMTSSVNTSTTTTGVYPVSSSALTGLTPGTTYHYRFVIVTNGVTVPGADMTFTSALAPSIDVTHDYPGGTTATLEGIYALNGGTFVSGEFEMSSDGGSTWSTPTGGTLTGSTTTPTVNLTGLTPGTTYHYRLTVINSEGTTTTIMRELTVSAKTVTISNEVTGAYANMDKSFTYTIYFQDSGGTALTGTFNYTGGVLTGSSATAPIGGTLTLGSGGEATFTLTAGQTITIAGVATSAKVRVVQTTDTNYTTSFKDSEDAGSTSGADTGVRNMTAADRTFDFTNMRSVVPGGISTGSGGIVLLSLMALLALAAGLIITAVHRRRAGAR